MKKLRIVVLIAGFLLGCDMALGQQATPYVPDSAIARGKHLVEMLSHGDHAGCFALFDSTMQAALPEARLQAIWPSVTEKAGAFREQHGARSTKYRNYDIVFVTCLFEKDTLDTRIVLDQKGRVAGLFFSKAKVAAEYKFPAYARPSAFREEQVIVGKGRWALHGTLTIPIGPKLPPAIVLVHGSGPNDRDETIGPNKPFRDLAWGLASKGIAVLRYEKRTREHALELADIKNTFTVKDETIDDALAAVKLLRSTKGIDTNRIFVLGHSLGGTLVPRIGASDHRIAGFVVLAGATRPLEDLMVEQTAYILSLSDAPPGIQQKQLAEVEEQREKVKKLTMADTSSTDTYFAAPASYWLDLKGYDPPKVAQSLRMPMLILQGERDYQVTMVDFNRWKEALQGRNTVTFKTYPKLNHLFIEGEGKSVPAEYETPGNVAAYVIDDIAGWIRPERVTR